MRPTGGVALWRYPRSDWGVCGWLYALSARPATLRALQRDAGRRPRDRARAGMRHVQGAQPRRT
ncbi:hypothetical protein NYR97_08575 [Xanthomonas hydrangeae]|uniref:Uncharacterized protein n=1 Tax=Xanthomonas hydrangeae TaxID=2775159 RepID=A0AAU0BHN0_9XANT|nr:hypothetical protein [Xanthomonas hydrangeae]WOB51396.1 hypothetical protein NYR97_08575 [Xanthomonas hydrangeae]